MELQVTKDQVQRFLNDPVWLQIKRELEEVMREGLIQLQEVDPNKATEIANIQGGLRQLVEVVKLPETYLEELKEEEELKADAD